MKGFQSNVNENIVADSWDSISANQYTLFFKRFPRLMAVLFKPDCYWGLAVFLSFKLESPSVKLLTFLLIHLLPGARKEGSSDCMIRYTISKFNAKIHTF